MSFCLGQLLGKATYCLALTGCFTYEIKHIGTDKQVLLKQKKIAGQQDVQKNKGQEAEVAQIEQLVQEPLKTTFFPIWSCIKEGSEF